MQKSSPVVSKRKTPELDRELSLEKLKRKKGVKAIHNGRH